MSKRVNNIDFDMSPAKRGNHVTPIKVLETNDAKDEEDQIVNKTLWAMQKLLQERMKKYDGAKKKPKLLPNPWEKVNEGIKNKILSQKEVVDLQLKYSQQQSMRSQDTWRQKIDKMKLKIKEDERLENERIEQ